MCTAAVIQDGLALEHTSQEMKGDRELCTAAVAQDVRALQYCSAELQKDLKISKIAAVQQDEMELRDAPEEVMRGRDVCMSAVA